jgi:hypothetical protein
VLFFCDKRFGPGLRFYGGWFKKNGSISLLAIHDFAEVLEARSSFLHSVVNFQVLVLDEADRILDMGFSKTLNAIVSQLSRDRQTLLFSATQTRDVKDLARLSLVDPEYLAVHAESTAATPARLQQTAMIVPLEEKMNMLWSFVKTHLHFKTLVFLSSCKQVLGCVWFSILQNIYLTRLAGRIANLLSLLGTRDQLNPRNDWHSGQVCPRGFQEDAARRTGEMLAWSHEADTADDCISKLLRDKAFSAVLYRCCRQGVGLPFS